MVYAQELFDKENGPGKEVRADGRNCNCPRCGVLNFNPARGMRAPLKKGQAHFERICVSCGEPVLYVRWWEQEAGEWRLLMKAKAYPLPEIGKKVSL